MGTTAHDYAVMLERVMCFGVIVETLTKQERVDRPGRKKPTSRHVPSGSFRVMLNMSGNLPIQHHDKESEQERAQMHTALQWALKPIRDRLAAGFRKAVESAQDALAAREAVALSTVIKELDSMGVQITYPSGGGALLTLSGSVILTGKDAADMRDELVAAIEGVLRPPREAGVQRVRQLALAALG